jgi:hypothetical protein
MEGISITDGRHVGVASDNNKLSLLIDSISLTYEQAQAENWGVHVVAHRGRLVCPAEKGVPSRRPQPRVAGGKAGIRLRSHKPRGNAQTWMRRPTSVAVGKADMARTSPYVG